MRNSLRLQKTDVSISICVAWVRGGAGRTGGQIADSIVTAAQGSSRPAYLREEPVSAQPALPGPIRGELRSSSEKSCVHPQVLPSTFRESYIPTVEDTYRQVISCDKSICTLQITDTTGSHQFPAMQRLSISKGHAFILVYSITSRQSLEELKPIYEQICEIKGDVESIPIMLVGNKCDESPNREVESSEAEVLARKWKCAFMETSAKLNLNVKELFQELLNLEKRRTVSLQIDGKKSKQQKRKEKLKGKCVVM
ncbi:hypothetical protein CapIbe_007938 [Capra ibex]